MKKTTGGLSILITLIVLACNAPLSQQFTAEGASKLNFPADLKINQIQVLGTHNSYARPVDTAVLRYIDPLLERLMGGFVKSMKPAEKAQYEENHPHMLRMSEMLAYDHPTFEQQLNAGLRSFEIDVYNDPTGNRFHKPAAYTVLTKQGISNLAPYDTTDLSKPGLKVMHIADIDFRTHYPTFKRALQALKHWSDAHPKHIPIFVMIEAKDRGIPVVPGSAQVLPFDEKAYLELDNEIFSVIGKEKVITPDQVKGNYPTLEAGILAHNWPFLSNSLGKFVFMLLPSAGGLSTETPYVKNRPSLEGRAMFVQSLPGQSHAGFLLLDNATMRKTEIQDAVKKGYLVRTRSDIDTYEAKVNDKTRAEAAFESGAQVVSTDYFRPGNAYGTNYYVTLPGEKPARINPVNGFVKVAKK